MTDDPAAEPTSGRTPSTDFLTYALNAAARAAEGLLEETPELRSVAVVFDWSVPLGSEVVPGLTLARKEGGSYEPVKHVGGLYGLTRQSVRLTQKLHHQLVTALDQTNQLALNMAVNLREQRDELARLRAEIAEREARLRVLAVAATTPDAGLPDLPDLSEFTPAG